MTTATLNTTATVLWTDQRGCDRDVEVNVRYSFDGDDDLRILSSELLGPCDMGDWEFDEALWEVVMDKAVDAYPEWLAEYQEARAAESYVPGLV